MKPRKSIRTAHNSSGRRKNNTHGSIDRISALPDSILAEILSLLPTKNAFTTSTLSKRWKFLWRAVHNLDFWFGRKTTDTYRVWPAGGFVEGVGKFVPNLDEQVESKKFVQFVNHVLLHHDAPVLNMFRLVCKPSCIESHVTSWIKTAITKNVHELSVTLESYYDAPIDVPISVFGCGSLRSLKLKGWFYLSGATVFCLPRLETLDLHGDTFECDEIFEKMIRGCRVLNYLHIDMNDQGDDSRFIISSTSLRRLELLNSGSHKYLKLEASSLEHLKLFGYISVNFVQEKLRSLVKAEVGIYLDYDDFSQPGICNLVVDAVSALYCAKNLTLSDRVMRALSRATINLSTGFERLVKLETTFGCRHWSSLQDFIQRSNNLEILTIRKFLDDGNDHDHSNWTTPVEVPRCLSTSLKKVELCSYYGDEDGREMIRYMLKHGSVLEVMQIFCYTDKNRKTFELLQEICEFPRQSPSCEVKFSGWKSKSKVKAL